MKTQAPPSYQESRDIQFSGKKRLKAKSNLNSVSNSQYNLQSIVFSFSKYFLTRPLHIWLLVLVLIELISNHDEREFLLLTLLPLCLLFLLAVSKEVLELLGKYSYDVRINHAPCKVWSGQEIKEISTSDLAVGDFVILYEKEIVPADAILLCVGSQDGSCFVDTSAILDNRGLLSKYPVDSLKYQLSFSSLSEVTYKLKSIKGTATVPAPNADFSSFEGKIKLKVSPSASSVKMKNLLLRDSIIRNSPWVLGLVVYVGNETKTWISSRNAQKKTSANEKKLNVLTLVILAVILAFSFICFPLSEHLAEQKTYGSSSRSFFHFVLLFSVLVPAPVFIVNDLVKIVKVVWMQRRLGVTFRNNNVLDDLGKIEFVLTDKTGTVTEKDVTVCMAIFKNQYFADVEDLKEKEVTPNDSFHQEYDFFNEKEHFFMCLAVCNKGYTNNYGESYLTKSADERVLISTATILGIKLVKRDLKVLTVLKDFQELSFHILGCQTMSETRKKCHIVLKNKSSTVLYIIGSFEAMDEAVGFTQTTERETLEVTNSNKKQGIRQLILAYKQLTGPESEAFKSAFSNANRSPINRQGRIESLFDELESGCTYLGVIGLEESVEEDTKQTVQALREAGVKFWMFSGDSFEGSLSAGISSGIVEESTPVVSIHDIRSEDEFLQISETILEKYLSPANQGSKMRRSSLSIFNEPLACFVTEKNSFIPREKEGLEGDNTICGSSERLGPQLSLQTQRPLLNQAPALPDPYLEKNTGHDLPSMLSSKLSQGNDLTRGKLIHPLVKKLTLSKNAQKDFKMPALANKFTLIIDSKSLDFAFKAEENLKDLVMILYSASNVLVTSVLPSHKTRVAALLKHNFAEEPSFLAIGDGGSDVGMITTASVGCGIVNFQGNQAACACDVVVNDFADLKELLIQGKLFQQGLKNCVLMTCYSLTCLGTLLMWINLLSDYSGPVLIPFDWLVFYYFVVSAFMPCVLWLFQTQKSEKSLLRVKKTEKNKHLEIARLGIQVFALAAVQSGSVIVSIKYGLVCSSCSDSASEALLIFTSSVVSVFFTLALFSLKSMKKSLVSGFLGVFVSLMMVVIDSETNKPSEIFQILSIFSKTPVLVIHCLLLILFNCGLPVFCYFWTQVFKKDKKKSFKRNNKKKSTLKSVFKLKGDEFENCSRNGGEFSSFTLNFNSPDRKLKYSQSILPFRMKILQNFSYAVIVLALILLLVELSSSDMNPANISFYSFILLGFSLALGYSRYFFQEFHKEKLETSRKKLFVRLKLSTFLQVFYQTINIFIMIFSYFWDLRIVLSLLYPSSFVQFFHDDWVLVQVNSVAVSVCLFRFSISWILSESSTPATDCAQFITIYLVSLVLCLMTAHKSKTSSMVQFNSLQQKSDDYKKGTSVLDFLLPAFVRKRVKDGVRYIAEDQGEVSVLFCYIVGFDQITNEYSIEELTGLLDEIFGKIDSLCEMLGVTKIETVANTYMACAGLKDGDSELKPSLRNLPHARRAVELAFAILRAKDQILLKNGERVTLKVGIHSGTVTAGVVGFHKPQFSLVGDTVNTASRMASNAEKNTIHISKKTFELIGEPRNFSFKANNVEIKGKGLMETFTIYLYQMVQDPNNENRISGTWTNSYNGNSLNVEPTFESGDEKSDLIQDLRLLNSTEFLNKHAEYKGRWVKFSLTDEEKELVKWRQRELQKFYTIVLLLKLGLSFVLLVTVFTNHYSSKPLLITGLFLDIFFAISLLIFFYHYKSSLYFTLGYSVWMILVTLLSTIGYLSFPGSDILLMFTWLHFQLLLLSPLFLSHLILPVSALLLFLISVVSSQKTVLGSFLPGSLFFILIQTLHKLFTESKERLDESISTLASEEYEKITKLLTQMIPEHVFNHLKDENSVTDSFVQVTVIYADIVGFTPWSSGRDSAEIVNMLSSLFTKFDKSSVKNNVYKVHTIGDCYVAMGFRGGQTRDPVEECINVVNFAYSMIRIIKKVQRLNHELNMRIGIHTGDIIGGVMGTNIVRYDIYGTDVLFANSMESSGVPGKIVVSESTKNFLEKGVPKRFRFQFHTQVKILERTCKAFELVLAEGLDDENWFLEKLKLLGVDRESIFECMVFCIDHSECSTQVLAMIRENLVSIAGLYLISDVLFNCTKVDVQYSWSYLPQLESMLPEYLESFYKDQKALAVVGIWTTWGVFDQKYLKGLQCVIMNEPAAESRLLQVYQQLLRLSDDYSIKKLCKESGQSLQGDKHKLIERITRFMHFLLQSNKIQEQWVFIELSSSGERVDQVLEKLHKAVDQLSSSSLVGHEIESSGRKSLQKLLSKYPSTYICSHS